MEISDIEKGYDNNSRCFTISLKVNGVLFESVAFSETERDNIYNKLTNELKTEP